MKQANGCLSIIAHIYRTYGKIYIKIVKMNPFSSFVPNKKSLRNLAQRFIIISICISYMPLLFVSIVRTALSNLQHAIGYLKDKPILLIDAHAVKAAPVAAQRLRLSYTVIPVSIDVLDEIIDLFQCFLILGLPFDIFSPRLIMSYFSHRYTSMSSCSDTFLPALMSAILRSRIAAFSEDQNGSAMTSKGMRLSLLSLFR